MERKYYLRGLGLGIAVTAVIMGIALSGNQTMTNEEIIARAKELGLVENTVLADTGNKDAEQENTVGDRADVQDAADRSQDDLVAKGSDSDIDSEAEDSKTELDEDGIDEAEEETAPEADGTEQDNSDGADSKDDINATNSESEDVVSEVQDDVTDIAGDGTETENSSERITSNTVRVITIISGDSSYTVAKKLADVGVVSSAETFDTFLCQNGYDKRLRTGNFSIPADASDEQIARIVTGLE